MSGTPIVPVMCISSAAKLKFRSNCVISYERCG